MLVLRSLDNQGIITKPEEEEDKAFYDCFVQGESTFSVLLLLYLALQSLVQRMKNPLVDIWRPNK